MLAKSKTLATRLEYAADAERDFELIFTQLFESYCDLGETEQEALDQAAARVLRLKAEIDCLAQTPRFGLLKSDPGRGVRGKVAAYKLNFARIAEMSLQTWPLVGPDFDDRMRNRYVDTKPKVVALSDYLAPVSGPIPIARGSTWDAARSALAAREPSVFKAWLSRLVFLDYRNGKLRLGAPSRFVQRYVETHHMPLLLHHSERELGVIDEVTFVIQND